MKLATLRDGSRDGRLLVASRDLSRAIEVRDVAPTLQAALDGIQEIPVDIRPIYVAAGAAAAPKSRADGLTHSFASSSVPSVVPLIL